MGRYSRHQRPEWFEERGPIFQRAIDQFVAYLADKPGVSRILLIGSVARGEPRPADLDLAVIVTNAEEAVPLISLAKRRLSQITHLSDVFVFDATEKYLGRICQRSPSNCPTRSVECFPGCGAIKCLKIIPGFIAKPDILAGARLLWPAKTTTSSAQPDAVVRQNGKSSGLCDDGSCSVDIPMSGTFLPKRLA